MTTISTTLRSTGAPSGSSEMVDILDEVRRLGAMYWVLRSRQFPRNLNPEAKGQKQRTPTEIVEAVMRSERVQEIITSESVARDWPRSSVEVDARRVVTEMAHAFDLTAVRTIGYPLATVLKQIYSSVYTQPDRWSQLRDLSATHPIVFMPTHRSYLDFLLLSFLCFEFQVPLPAIAAGMDFMGMKLVGEMLRRSGAFFIRRQFGSDQLYWAIFTEYVQTHLRHTDRPVEFFLEGTRSRTGKSLHPKYGLLTVLLEPFFRSQLYDIMIVPVSTSYERIIEESLYAYELIGIPKPKESTGALFKARTVMATNYGVVHVDIGEPISVREYFSNVSLSRNTHALEPNVRFQLTPTELQGIRHLGHHIIKLQQRQVRVSVWNLACLLLQQSVFTNRNKGTPLNDLHHKLNHLFDFCSQLGHTVPLMHSDSIQDELMYYIQLHDNVVEIVGDTNSGQDCVQLCPTTQTAAPTRNNGSNVQTSVTFDTVQATVGYIMLGNYANVALHLFADLSLLSGAIVLSQHQQSGTATFLDLEISSKMFRRLLTLFAFEFIHIPDASSQSVLLADCVTRLQRCGAVRVESIDGKHCIEVINPGQLIYLLSLIDHYINGYALMLQSAADHAATKFTELELQQYYQTKCERRLNASVLNADVGIHPYMLSTDLAKNAISSMKRAKALVDSGSKSQYVCDIRRAQLLLSDLITPLVVKLRSTKLSPNSTTAKL